jgi:Tol biopolymer transport system component
VWSPDSTQVAFSSDRDGPQDIYAIGIDDAAQERLLHRSTIAFRQPSAWSRGPADSQWIVLTQQDPEVNIWLLSPVNGEMKPFLRRPFPEAVGVLDPTERWMAYLSLESGRPEVNIQSFPEPGEKVPVTRQGGVLPTWLPNGRLLFRAAAGRSMWEVPLGTGATPQPGEPRRLATFAEGTLWIEPLPDGRFLSIVRDSDSGTSVTLLQHWRTALRAEQR